MSARALGLLCCCLVAFCAIPVEAETTDHSGNSDQIRIERLAGLGRLWGVAKFFHPYLAYKEIDWDAALIAAIPKVNAAQSTEEYRSAIDGLLAALGDPLTRTVVEPNVQTSPPAPISREVSRIVDGALVVNCRTVAEDRVPAADYQAAARAVNTYLTNHSKGVVFDCRTAGAKLLQLYKFVVIGVLPLFKGTVTYASYRERQHVGLTPQASAEGGYFSGLVTKEPGVMAGYRDGNPVPFAFVVDARTPIMPAIVGLQAAGLAHIVEESGEAAAGEGVDFYSVPLPGGLSARVRVAELVSPSGEVGWRPDVNVPASAGSEAAVKAAVHILRSPVAPRPVAPAAVIVRPRGDHSYPEMNFPDTGYRLLALFRFWNIIQIFYPFRDLMDQDWDLALTEFIPRFEGNQNRLDYEKTIAALAHRLQDSHARIENSLELDRDLGLAVPPIGLRLVEGKAVVVALDKKAASGPIGLKIGDVVLAVDGKPIAERRAYVEQFLSASTPQSMNAKVGSYLLAGGENSVARLRIEIEGGSTREVEIVRSAAVAPSPQHTGAVYQVLPSGYGYIDLGRLHFSEADRALDTVLHTPAVILDMRGYPQGADRVIASRLPKVTKPVVAYQFRVPMREASGIDDATDLVSSIYIAPSAKPRYTGRVVMLINEQAISAAESACLVLAAASDVTFIGSPTAGADGNVTNFELPGFIRVIFTGGEVRYPDGRQIQRHGVQPQIMVEPTLKGIREGRDEILDAAVRYLSGRPN